MNQRKRRTFLAAVLLAGCFAMALAWPRGLSAQCAMCRTALTSSEEGRRWAQGINAGILLLLVAPFLIFGTIFLRVYSRQVDAAVRRFLQRRWEGISRTASAPACPAEPDAAQGVPKI